MRAKMDRCTQAEFTHPDEMQLRQFFARFFAAGSGAHSAKPKGGAAGRSKKSGGGGTGLSLKELEDSFIDAWPMEVATEESARGKQEVRLSKYSFEVVKNYMLKCSFKGAAVAAMRETVAAFEVEVGRLRDAEERKKRENEEAAAAAGTEGEAEGAAVGSSGIGAPFMAPFGAPPRRGRGKGRFLN